MNLLRPIDRTFTVNGLRLHLLDWGGEGRIPLLLLHGFTGHAHAWDTLSIALQQHFHVYALDQRGHGDSDPADVYNAMAAFDDISGVIAELGLRSLVLVGLSMGGRNAIYFTSKRPDLVQKLVIVDIGPEISKRAAAAPAGPPEPDTWDSIEQAAQHLYRGNPNPGIHYYRWVVTTSLRQRADGALVWAWHPSVKERRSPPRRTRWTSSCCCRPTCGSGCRKATWRCSSATWWTSWICQSSTARMRRATGGANRRMTQRCW